MKVLHEALEKVVSEAIAKFDIPVEEIYEIASKSAAKTASPLSKKIVKSIKQQAKQGGLDEHRSIYQGFQQRNFRTWKNGFDALQLFIECSVEAGIEHTYRIEKENQDGKEALIETLSRLQATLPSELVEGDHKRQARRLLLPSLRQRRTERLAKIPPLVPATRRHWRRQCRAPSQSRAG